MLRFVPRMCMHCHAPLCLKACPTGAIVRDPRGLVLIDAQKCNGCLDCTWACPFGVIFFDGEKGRVGKCDLCLNRIAKGEAPSCVHHCPAKALSLHRGQSRFARKDRKLISSGQVKILYSCR
jgi:Fe-S-cluster-containing dehydrogenase component